MPESVIQAAERLKHCIIENTDAVQLIQKHNQPDCFIYADPPYLMQTRRTRLYRHEMGQAAEHEQLLHALLAHRGPVMLSGYESELYNDMLRGWRKDSIRTTKTSSIPCTETIWMNYDAQQNFHRMVSV